MKIYNLFKYLCIYHYHHVAQLAQISLTLSRHPSLSFIASGRSSRLHPVSAQSCYIYIYIYIQACRPAFARPCEGLHKFIPTFSAVSACLVGLTWIVFVMSRRWSYSCCFVECFLQDSFNTARSILE